LRGIYLPAGSGTVVMEFAPPNYRVAKWVSLTSALLTLCLLIYVQCRRRTSGAQVPLSNEDSPRHSHLSTL